METILVTVGIACIVAAIVGGSVKLLQLEVNAVASIYRQIILGAFGVILMLAGLVIGGRLPVLRPAQAPPVNSATPSTVPTQQSATPAPEPSSLPGTERNPAANLNAAQHVQVIANGAMLPCSSEGSIKSFARGAKINLEIENLSDETLLIYWPDYSGRRKGYGRVSAMSSIEESTLSKHPWLLANEAGVCLAIWQGSETVRVSNR